MHCEANHRRYPSEWGFSLPLGHWIFSLIALIFGVTVILLAVGQDGGVLVALYGALLTLGLLLCRHTQNKLQDPALQSLAYLWLIKLGLTFLLLHFGWIPELDSETSAAWGYDPQRYYFESQQLIENGWSPEFVSLNYVGILYYYAAVFFVFGSDPLAASLVNAFATLLATLYLVRFCYQIKPNRSHGDWTISLALLIPELLWFDVLTSRETVVGALLVISLLSVGRYLVVDKSGKLLSALVVSGIATLAIATLRTSMVLPIVVSITLMIVFARSQGSKKLLQRYVLIAAAVGTLIAAPLLATSLGGYGFEFIQSLQTVTEMSERISGAAEYSWSENSIAMLLMPDSIGEALIYLPARMILYWIAPLPDAAVSLAGLADGSWAAWQKLLLVPSSILNICAVPLAAASLIDTVRNRRINPSPLILHISYWVCFIAVAGGNLIIHERYRVMVTLLFAGCIWLGYRTSARRTIFWSYFSWACMLFVGALFYLVYKIV